jgi:hypothetical protein
MRLIVSVLPLALFMVLPRGSRADLHSQHIADTSVKIGPVEPLWHLRVRTTPQGGGVAQIRTGPIVNTDLHERLTLIGGYYYTREKEERWTTLHRPFGGLEVVIWNRWLEIDARSLFERFVAKSEADYNVFRHRIRFSPQEETAPYAGVEAFFDTDGLRGMRYSVGLRRTIAEQLVFDFGYFFENRHPRAGPDRHMLTTTIHWRNRNRRLDTDP